MNSVLEVKFKTNRPANVKKTIKSLGARRVFSGVHKDHYYYHGGKCFKINITENGKEFVLIEKFPSKKYFRMKTIKKIPSVVKRSKLVMKSVVKVNQIYNPCWEIWFALWETTKSIGFILLFHYIYKKGMLKFYLQKFQGRYYVSIQGSSVKRLRSLAKKLGATNKDYITESFDKL